MRRAARQSLVTSRPNNSIDPAVSVERPTIELMVVVLPAPFGPSSPKNSPAGTSNEIPLTAVKSP